MTDETRRRIAAGQERRFLLAGNCRVTFKSVKTGRHFTFKIQKAKPAEGNTRKHPDRWFVSVMYDYEGEGYQYLGMINANGSFRYTPASAAVKDSPSFKCFSWTWDNLTSSLVEIWHEGSCGRCGRALTDPESIESGLGPKCRKEV